MSLMMTNCPSPLPQYKLCAGTSPNLGWNCHVYKSNFKLQTKSRQSTHLRTQVRKYCPTQDASGATWSGLGRWLSPWLGMRERERGRHSASNMYAITPCRKTVCKVWNKCEASANKTILLQHQLWRHVLFLYLCRRDRANGMALLLLVTL